MQQKRCLFPDTAGKTSPALVLAWFSCVMLSLTTNRALASLCATFASGAVAGALVDSVGLDRRERFQTATQKARGGQHAFWSALRSNC